MRSLKVLAISILMLLVPMSMLSIASAHHKDGHDKGKDHSGGVTEDNDDDGVGNTPDPYGDSDNKHPSGKDKHAEGGKSGNQGNSQSDPDGDSNGGADKPGGSGGVDQLDQDGNNGCGNDDDFEDDNNGNCGGPVKDKQCEKSLPPQAQGHAYGHDRASCEDSTDTDGTEEVSVETEEKVLSETSTKEDDSTAVVISDSDTGTRSGTGTGRPGTEGTFDALDLEAASSDVTDATQGGTSQYRSPSLLPLTGLAILIYLVVAGGLLATGAYFYTRDRRTV